MKKFLLIFSLLLIGCSEEELITDISFDSYELPPSINRDDLLVDNVQGAPIQKYFNFNSSFYSQVHYDLNNDADIIEMQFDGSYTPLNLTERVFGEPQDSLNGLTFDVDKNKTKLLANFWGEGNYGSWYRPNILVLFDLQLNTHEIIIDNRNTNNSTFYTVKLFDLDSDGNLDIYLAENGYILSTDKNKIHQTNTGPGPVFIFDIDSDGIDDLIHFNTVNNSWIKFKGGTNLNKTEIISDYSFRNYVDDYTITDYDRDGDLDLIFLDAETDPTNNGCTLCTGKITLLENQNGNLIDVTNQKFDTSTYPQMLGDNNILIYDFDFDGDDDLFFPDWYYQDGQEFNNYYWENNNGKYEKKERKNLDNSN